MEQLSLPLHWEEQMEELIKDMTEESLDVVDELQNSVAKVLHDKILLTQFITLKNLVDEYNEFRREHAYKTRNTDRERYESEQDSE